jgi:siroheme synthase
LIDRGWSRETPAAIVADASLPHQQVWRGTLDDLASDRARLEGDGPATIVVGAVAALALIAGDAHMATVERARKRS